MSGIEIAGLVLGAFPLLIYALDRYGEGAAVLKDWWRIQRAYKKCRQDVDYHRILFQDNVERFLLPLVVDDEELEKLMHDPAGSAWENEDLETRLKERLPNSYNAFLDTMRTFNEVMEELKKELGVRNAYFMARVDKEGKLSRDTGGSRKDLLSRSNFEFQEKRVKFSLKKCSREKLFRELQESNDRMRRLLESHENVATARRSREQSIPKSTMSRKLMDFWRHAKRLHEALAQAWKCECQTHTANLQLQHRNAEDLEFDVLFHVRESPAQRRWKATKIKMRPVNGGVVIRTQQPPARPNRTHRQVHWGACVDEGPQPIDRQDLDKIQDLCTTLSTNCVGCFGVLDREEYQFLVYPAQAPAGGEIDMVSLEVLLKKEVLTRKKRYSLALILASSYLQLSSTPWLAAPLQMDSIVFFKDPSTRSALSVENPYIVSEMTSQGPASTADALSLLGIRLTELCFGVPLEQCRFRREFPTEDSSFSPLLDRAAAILWSETINEEAGPDYAEAVQWCLRAKELNDGTWRSELWSNVIGPLEKCCKQLS